MTNKNVIYLLLSSGLSDLANWIYRITVLSYVVEKYNTAFSSSLVTLMMVMPSVVLGYCAGKIADSRNKKIVMVSSDIIRIILIGMFHLPEKYSFIFVLLVSSVAVFSDVCEDSIIPELVEENLLAQTNSAYSLISSAIMIVGPIIGGLTATYCSKTQSLAIIISLLLIAGCMRVLIKYNPQKVKIKTKGQQLSSFLDVCDYVISDKKLNNIIRSTGLIAFAGGMLNSLLLVFVYQVLGRNSADYGIMLSIKGLAMTISALLLVKWSKKMDCEMLYVSSIIGMGVALLLFPINRIWILSIAIQAFNAIFNIVYSVTRKTLIQQICEPEKMGRLFGFLAVVGNIASVISLVVFGSITDYIGVTKSLLIGGVIVLYAGIATLRNIYSRKKGDVVL